MLDLKHIPLTVPCEPPDGTHCPGQRIMSTWLDATYKYMHITTCTVCDAPSPDEPFADTPFDFLTEDDWPF